MGIEFAVAEMIGLFYKHVQQGQLLNYLLEFCRQFLILERIRRWERYARVLKLPEVGGPRSFLVVHHVLPEFFFHLDRVVARRTNLHLAPTNLFSPPFQPFDSFFPASLPPHYFLPLALT